MRSKRNLKFELRNPELKAEKIQEEEMKESSGQ